MVCALVCATSCRDTGGEGESADAPVQAGSTTDEGSDESGTSGGLPEVGTDVCLSAPVTPPGRYEGTLAGKTPSGGACGEGGPEVFFRIDVARRSDVRVSAQGDGFAPRLGVFGNDCAVPFGEGGLLCTTGTAGWVTDVAAGTELYVALGATTAEVESSRTGRYALEVSTRSVLSVGAPCGPATWGRCETGSACLGVDEDAPSECTEISGDRCGNAIALSVPRGESGVTIDDVALHTDAHHHSCGGERTAERVYRLELPTVSDDAVLRISGDAVSALAARAPTCLLEDERGCAASSEATPSLDLVGPLPDAMYLFVELPEGDPDASEVTPAIVRFDLQDDRRDD